MGRTIGLAVLAVFLASPAFGGEVRVHIGHNKVEPTEVRIAVGDTVVFHNLDAMPGGHTVVADDGSFGSPPLDKDAQWRHTFEKAGSHGFHIEQHPSAKGTIVVE